MPQSDNAVSCRQAEWLLQLVTSYDATESIVEGIYFANITHTTRVRQQTETMFRLR